MTFFLIQWLYPAPKSCDVQKVIFLQQQQQQQHTITHKYCMHTLMCGEPIKLQLSTFWRLGPEKGTKTINCSMSYGWSFWGWNELSAICVNKTTWNIIEVLDVNWLLKYYKNRDVLILKSKSILFKY